MDSYHIITNTVSQTEQLGFLLGVHLQAGDIICLSGTLGAGKTTLTRGIVRGWGSGDQVTSPTFTLINVYTHDDDGSSLHHIDCYRLAGSADAWTTGLEDSLDGTGIVVIEWPDRVKSILPDGYLWIDITTAEQDRRHFSLIAHGQRARHLIQAVTAHVN